MSDALNWHDLEILQAVLEQGSFSAAARSLGLSQPTISRHIEALERKLGKDLFTRGNGEIEPTRIALDLGEHTAGMNEGMFAIQRVLDGKEEAPAGIVTVSLPHGTGGIPLAKALEDFHLDYPDISIDLKFGPPQSNLGRREADIDLRMSEPNEPELVRYCLGNLHFGVYASDHYLNKHGAPQNIAELSEHYWPHADDFLMEPVLASLAPFGVAPQRFPFRCSGNTMLVQVLAYMGITLGMIPIGLEYAQMQRIFPEYCWRAPPMWLTMHSSLRRNTRIRSVWDRLVEHLPGIFALSRADEAKAPRPGNEPAP